MNREWTELAEGVARVEAFNAESVAMCNRIDGMIRVLNAVIA